MKTVMYTYAVVWAIVFGYLVVQYTRIESIKKELENLKKSIEKNSK